MSGAFEALDVAVVGGGISGLAAAHALRKAGSNVVVLEAAPVFGGCIGSVRTDPYLADRGPQSFTSAAALLDLARDLGLESQIVTAQTTGVKRYIYRHGRLNAVPASPGQFISTPLLSAGGKWRLLAEPFVPKRVDASDESVASFVTRRAGAEMLDAAVAPVMSGIYAGDPARLSARSTLPTLVRFEQEQGSVVRGLLAARPAASAQGGTTADSGRARTPISFAGGNATLIDALVKSLSGHTYAGARVTRIRQRGAGFALDCEGLSERAIEAARVIIATPAGSAADLLEALEPDAATELRAIEYPPIAQVALAYPRAKVGAQLDGFGFLVSRGEGIRILGAVWNSAVFAGRCPDDEVMITAFIGGATDAAIADMGDEDLTHVAHSDLSRIMRIEGRPKVVAGFRWSNGIPQYTLGHELRLGRISAATARIPGLLLTGNYFRGASVADCINRANAAASAIMPR